MNRRGQVVTAAYMLDFMSHDRFDLGIVEVLREAERPQEYRPR